MAKGKYKEWLRPENLILLKGWARDGLSDEQIAHNMGISVACLYNWKNKYVEIVEALRESKEIADKAVENALYKRAVGYDYEEVRVEQGAKGTVLRRIITTKTVIPDTAAQALWLKNRNPEVWGDKEREINAVPIINVIAPPRCKDED